MPRRTKRQKYNSTFPRHTRDRVDIDYAHKLTKEEKAWLNKFNREYARGEFSKNPLHQTKEQQRDLWNGQKDAENDIFNQEMEVLHPDTADPESGETTWEMIAAPSQSFQTLPPDPAHTTAVESLKETAPPPPKRKNGKPQPNPTHKAKVKAVAKANKKFYQNFHITRTRTNK